MRDFLLPHSLLERFEKVGDQSKSFNPVIVAKYYDVVLGLEWFAASYNPETEMFYGWLSGNDYSPGTFALDELLEVSALLDLTWKECRLSEVSSYA